MLLSMLVGTAFGQGDAQPPQPVVIPEIDSNIDRIIFPMEGGDKQVEPLPAPVPVPINPKIVSEVVWGKLYIIQSPSEVFFRQLPIAVATISDVRAGLPADVRNSPVIVSAVFAGGNGQPETKVFRAAYIYRVDPLKAGSTSLVSIPKGVNLDSEIITSALVVSNTAPNPPPEPEPTPTPTPLPPEPELDGRVDHVHLSVVFDSRNISQPTGKVINGLLGWEVFITSGNTYLTYDLTTTEIGGKQAKDDIKAKGCPYPAISIRDKATGNLLDVSQLPLTTSDLKAHVNKFLKVAI